MQDDERTRILPQGGGSGSGSQGGSTGDGNATRIVGGAGQPAGGDDSPVTRIHSGAPAGENAAEVDTSDEPVVGWLVVINGPGRGNARSIHYGMNSLGREISERIALNFGDTKISRNAHAFVVYDEKQQDFYIQHGGKSNLVRLNGAPVLTPSELNRGDRIELGNTELMFVPLCDESFNWEMTSPA